MASPTTKSMIPPLEAGPPEISEAIKGIPASRAADYVYRIAALTAGIALLMTAV